MVSVVSLVILMNLVILVNLVSVVNLSKKLRPQSIMKWQIWPPHLCIICFRTFLDVCTTNNWMCVTFDPHTKSSKIFLGPQIIMKWPDMTSPLMYISNSIDRYRIYDIWNMTFAIDMICQCAWSIPLQNFILIELF